MDKTVVPDVSSPRSKEAQQKLLELTKHGLLNVGDKVQFHYKTKEFIATVTAEGCLLYQGENGESELFLSPSAFVNTLAKRQSSSSRGRSKPKLNLNGWEFCMVAGVSLSQLKQQLESIQQAEGSSSKWRVQKEQEGTTGKSEMREQADAEETLSPLKKKQRVEETNQQQYDQGEMMQSGAELAQREQVADVLKPTVEEEKQQEEEEEEEEEELLSQPTESENDENKNIKKRTTRLSSGSIKHVSYTKGTKQTSNDEGSSVDPEKSDDDKELEDMQTEESNTASRGGRRRKLSRNSNRSKLTKGKLEASSDEEGKSVSRRHLRRDKTKVSSNQEADPSSNSEDNGEVKQENDELNSQATGEEDAEDMEEPWTYLLEQIAEAERIELHCGWSKEDRENLLVALKETKQLDATVLSQHVKSKSPEEITEYLKVLKDRLGKKDDEGMQPDVSFYAALLSLELYHSGAISPGGLFSKKLEHMDKNTVFHDSVSQGKSPFKRGISDSDRKLKKMRKELEELRNKVEMEMASRRDLELEKQLLDVQLQEAKRATEREARKRAAIEDENEELKVRELETRRRLDRLKLKLNAIKGEPNTSTAITPGEGKDVSLSSPRSSNPETMNANSCHVETTTKDESSHVVQEESTETKSHREQILEEEIERLKSKVASLETEVSDFQQDAENERRKNHHLMEAKKYLEISLNEVLHASKSTSAEEMESTSHEAADVPAKNLDNSNNHHMYSKDVYEKRANPSAFRISSSVIARRRKSVAFRSMVL